MESAEEKLRVSRDSELKYVARIVSNELRLQEMIAKLARITLLADSHDVTKSISEKIVLASKKYDLIKQERERIEKSWAELNGKNTEFSNLKKAVGMLLKFVLSINNRYRRCESWRIKGCVS